MRLRASRRKRRRAALLRAARGCRNLRPRACAAYRNRMATAHARIRVLPSALLAAGALSACVVVPVDPRTGQPYPAAAVARGAARHGGHATAAARSAPQPTLLNVRLYPASGAGQRGRHAGRHRARCFHTGRGTFSVGYRRDTCKGERVASRVGGATPGAASPTPGAARHQAVRVPDQRVNAGQGTGSCLFGRRLPPDAFRP